jgi:hypothetical protein
MERLHAEMRRESGRQPDCYVQRCRVMRKKQTPQQETDLSCADVSVLTGLSAARDKS